jgi:ubiquinone/menaquinone biosynthesis C-methylase UbiE
MENRTHHELILDQFTRQATPFSTAATITDDTALRMVVQAAEPHPDDKLLDVACGGGLIVCAFAPLVRHATGIDMTPAMLDHARRLSQERSISNVTFKQDDASALTYPDRSFDIVTTRFSFHHFLEPLAVLREMRRICVPDGRIVVVDMYASEDPAKAAEWNRLEKMRDPSHVRCLSLSELKQLFTYAGLPSPQITFYELGDLVENLLARSFPNPGDEARITEMFAASVEDDRLGIPVSRDELGLRYAYRVAVLVARRDLSREPRATDYVAK